VLVISDIGDNFMQGFNKQLVQNKLRELGMGELANKLNNLSEQEIEKLIRANPSILRKASEMMKGGNPFK